MKHLKLFFALFAMLALGVGNAWGAEVTINFGSGSGDVNVNDFNISTTDTYGTTWSISTVATDKSFTSDADYSQIGASKKPATTITLTGTIVKACTINSISSKWGGFNGTAGNIEISVNGSSYATGKLNASNDVTVGATNDIIVAAGDKIVITVTNIAKGVKLYSLSYTYTQSTGGGETPEPDPEPDPTPGTGGTGTINFNNSAVEINAASVTGDDNLGNTWTITTVGTTSYTASSAYYQVGSGNKPATSITFTTTLPSEGNITAFSAKFGGFSGTAGTVTLKVGETSVGTGTISSSADVIVENSESATGKVLTVTVTDINKGVKVYYISYTYTVGGAESTTVEVPAEQFAWSASTAEATMPNTIENQPTLTNALSLPITYSSSTPATATIDANTGAISLVAAGTTTINAIYTGGADAGDGKTYAAKTVSYTLTVNKAPATPTENVYVKVTSTAGITDGEYLIVYEDASNGTPAPVAFDGSLEELDAVGNTLEVTINNNTIAGTNYIDAATFTLDVTNGTILSASGKYIGKTANSNGLDVKTTAMTNTFAFDANGNAVITGNTAALRYNKAADQKRFRYYKDGGGSQEKIALYKKASSHTLIYGTCTNGSVSADVASGATVLSGTTVTLENTPAPGYKLAAYDVYKTDDATTKVTETDGKFIMPEFDVTISATFELAKTLTGIEITNAATQITFWQTEEFNHDGLKVIAHFNGAEDEDVTDKVTVTGSTTTAGTQTVTVSYKEGATTETATYTITVKAIPNTKETAYTVADAYDIIDKLTTANGVFISGTISQIDSYSDQYKSITYWISADGTTTKQLQVYSGKGLESADFDAVTDLTVGDKVIVCGNLKKYSGTYEFDKNNYLASHTPTTKDPAGLAYATTSYTANVGEAFTTPELTNPHNLDVTYSTSDASKATVDVNTGAVTIVAAGEVTITASTTGDASHDAGSASYNITITDPSLAVATLPFYFNGKQADIEGTAGMTHYHIDADDYESAPYLKMNTTGDWLVIHFDSEPDQLSYDIKNNSFSGGTFSVQESADGETYIDVKVHTEITETQNEEHTLSSTSRYVKFIYTEKVNGNVGLGNIRITKPDNRANAELAWSEETVSLTVGDAFTAPTLSNPHSVSDITYESSNEAVATVSSEGVIALVDDAVGTATITATFAGDGTYKPATATCTITVNEYIETIDGEWQLVTDASKLQAGMEIIIASVEVDGKYYTMSKASDNGNNRTAVESTISGDKLNPAVGTSVLTLVDAGNGTFALQAGNGKYLYAASSGSNHLKEKDEIDVNGQWTITIADNVATIKAEGSSNRNWMQFNPNNGSPLFSCYAYDKPQKDIALYAKVPEHSRTTSVGRYGTICLPGNIVKCLGATLYEVAGREGDKVIFDEVITPKAGMPYIFLAHNAEVLFFCGDQTAAAGNHKSLYGTFTVLQNSELEGMYMVQNNKIVKCNPANSGIAENRAYFKGSELDVLGKPGAPMPGRRRITMGTESENTATGTEDVIAPEGQTLKLIENGQLIIIRNGEKFNAQGQKL